MTPARYVERVRVEIARRKLEESAHGIDGVATESGFGSAETMRRAFLRTLSVSPAEYRSRFRPPSAGSRFTSNEIDPETGLGRET